MDRYKVLDHLGSGGMGEVYAVLDQQSGDRLAMKVISAEHANVPYMERRLENEAKAAGTLSHLNIVGVHGFGNLKQGSAYLLMDFVDGQTLEELLKERGHLSPECALDIFIQITAALVHAHAKGIVHRDLKPSNVLLVSEGDHKFLVKLTDFGIAKIIEPTDVERVKLTQTGEIIGSPLFMSPEQCKGESLDARSDIYSLGCMLFAILSGKVPFDGDNPVKVLLKHLSDEPPALPTDLGLKAGWNQVIKGCLAKEPSDRYQNAQSLLQDLERLRDHKPPRGSGSRLTKLTLAKLRSGNVLVGSVVTVAILVLIIDQSHTFRPGDKTSSNAWKARSSSDGALLKDKNSSGKLGSSEPNNMPSPTAMSRYTHVKDLRKTRNFRDALREINAALEDVAIKNDRPFFLNEKAAIASANKDYKRAADYYSASLKIRTLVPTLIARGEIFLQTDDLVKALGDFDAALTLDAHSRDAQRLRTVTYERLKERLSEPDQSTRLASLRATPTKEAIAPAVSPQKVHPKAFDQTSPSTSSPNNEAPRLTEISEKSPQSNIAMTSLGPQYDQIGKDIASRDQNDKGKGLSDGSEHADSFCPNADTAVEIHAALRRAPGNIEETYKRASSLFRTRKYREAATALQTIATVDSLKPYSAWLYGTIGICLEAAKDYDAAVNSFTESLVLSRDNGTNRLYGSSMALLRRGTCLARSGDNENALADLNTALSDHPAFMLGYRERARIYLKMGRSEEAARDEAKARALAEHVRKPSGS
jgi:serine/threonine protein kinase